MCSAVFEQSFVFRLSCLFILAMQTLHCLGGSSSYPLQRLFCPLSLGSLSSLRMSKPHIDIDLRSAPHSGQYLLGSMLDLPGQQRWQRHRFDKLCILQGASMIPRIWAHMSHVATVSHHVPEICLKMMLIVIEAVTFDWTKAFSSSCGTACPPLLSARSSMANTW